MIIFPAMDLKNGECVRLIKGDFSTSVTYRSNPFEVAKEYQQAGASWLHIIDLDGAQTGFMKNLEVIATIKQNTSLQIQVGGGIRDKKRIVELLELGIDRIIVGTYALEQFKELEELLKQYPGRIIVSVDSKNGFVTYHGWQNQSTKTTLAFCQSLEQIGVDTIVYTNIEKDGMMEGPAFADYTLLKEQTSLQVIASGGVSSIQDVKQLKAMNQYGAIIGKALYIKEIDLKEAIICSQDESSRA
jgi:phosphoribosylformimino-5-aminoimidazole carboxamide ribotide isomerase